MLHFLNIDLRHGTKYKDKQELEDPKDMHDMLQPAQNYINCEKKKLVDKKEKSKTLGNKDDKGREERTRK
jgi:hypothetical protein